MIGGWWEVGLLRNFQGFYEDFVTNDGLIVHNVHPQNPQQLTTPHSTLRY